MKCFVGGCLCASFVHFFALAQWVPVNTGLGNRTIGALLSSTDTLYAGSESGVYRSTSFGGSWTLVSSGLPPVTPFYSMVQSGGVLIAGGYHFGLWRSSDSGVSWARSLSGVDSNEYVQTLAVDGNTVYAAIGFPAAVGISTDNGATWTKSINGLSTTATITGVARLGSRLFATHQVFGPYFSTDNGGNWTLLAGVIGAQDKNALIESGGNLCVGATNGIYLSTDTGATWARVLTSDIITGFSTDGTIIYALGRSLYKSADNGQSWVPVDNTGLPGSVPGTMQFAGSYAFVNIGGVGVYRRPISELTGVIDISGVQPTQYTLDQNYPNPFNPSTTISFTISHASSITLAICDVLGRPVATLVHEVRPAGRYNELFNATGLGSGMYFYRLTAPLYSATKKLVLLR